MKYLALFFCLIVVASAQSPEEDCQSCLDKVGIALMHMSEDQVENIIELLSEQVCPIMPWDVDECKVGVATWWPKISEKIFDLAAAKYICGPDFIGVCPEPPTKQIPREWTCLDCHTGVVMFGLFYENDEVIKAITEGLQGEDFCANPDNAFPEDQIEQCAQNMSIFMPPALKLIGDQVIFYFDEICNSWYNGICTTSTVPFYLK